MPKKTNKQKAAAARREVRSLEAEHQTGLRRSVGSVIRNGTGYGGTRTVAEMQKAGMWTAGGFPFDVLASGVLEFLGDIRVLGGASDITCELMGGHTTGRFGGMAMQQALGIRYVNGAFVSANGEALPPKS